MSTRDEAMQAFTLAILDAVESKDKHDPSRAAKFNVALRKAAESLSKEHLIEILMFIIQDHDIFFDTFESSPHLDPFAKKP